MNAKRFRARPSGGKQAGITTLAITLMLLMILTLIVLFSTSVSFFEQRTATNENRAQITQQVAEYALNLSGEYLKANRADLVSNTGTGWFGTGTALHWKRCPALVAGSPHPCDAERDATRRAQMYYYDNDASTAAIEGIPYTSIAGSVGGALTGATSTSTVRYSATTTVNALLCRIDFDLTNPTSPAPICNANPASGRNVALTLVADVTLPGENSAATVKETWATVSAPSPTAAVPLIASGLVQGLGNAQIVASPNAGGYGVAASIWAPSNVDIGSTAGGCGAGGVGSVSTCHLGEYLRNTPRTDLLTTCAGNGNNCGCPAISASGEDFLSGHSQSLKVERYDILDMDGNCGSPDIQFFPKEPYDDPNDGSDDSLFEYTFPSATDVVAEGTTTVMTTTTTPGNPACASTVVAGQTNCAAFVLTDEYGATVLTDCSSLNTSSNGIYYVTGNCDLNSTGSPSSSVILVVDGSVRVNGNIDFYGMLFVRSNNNSNQVNGTGNVNIFGSMIVEGNVDLHGGINLVYQDTSATAGPYGKIPGNVHFAKVTGSWLDSRTGI